ncbi:MAG: hypothetical protein Q9192_006629 [Flavoplaca navasiana]
MESNHDYPTGSRLGIILLSLFLGTFLVAIDTTIVSVAIPKISTEFHALNDVGWYGSAYLMTITALQPVGGTIYKSFNVKAVYMIAMVVFEAGSALCAAAPNSPLFILGRAAAGSGAALLIQGAISVITQISSLEKRPLYIGLVVSCFGISASFSPVLGGALTARVGWRWCFWINLPIGAVIFLLVIFGLRVKSTQGSTRKMSALAKLKQLDLLRIIFLLASKLYYLPFYFQAVRSASALRSGVDFLALAVPQVIATVLAGGLATKTGHYVLVPLMSIENNPNNISQYFLMLGGAIICSIGTGLLVMLDITSPTAVWATSMVVAGFGDGMCTNMPYTAIQAIIDQRRIHRKCAIGISIGNNILISQLLNEVPKQTDIPPEAVIEAGALNLGQLTRSSEVLHELRQAYGHAISAVMICATVTICVSILATLGMQRLNLVKISRNREAKKGGEQTTSPIVTSGEK